MISSQLLEYQYVSSDTKTAELLHKVLNQVPLSGEDILHITRGKFNEITDAVVRTNARLLQIKTLSLLAKSLGRIEEIIDNEEDAEAILKSTKLLLEIYQKLKIQTIPLAENTDDISSYIAQKLNE